MGKDARNIKNLQEFLCEELSFQKRCIIAFLLSCFSRRSSTSHPYRSMAPKKSVPSPFCRSHFCRIHAFFNSEGFNVGLLKKSHFELPPSVEKKNKQLHFFLPALGVSTCPRFSLLSFLLVCGRECAAILFLNEMKIFISGVSQDA